MMDDRKPEEDDKPLNPSLRERRDASHPTGEPDPAPAESASVRREEGSRWPVIWAIVTIVCVVLALWFLF